MLKSHYRWYNGKHVANQVVEGLPLTPREIETVEFFSQGLVAKQIASQMGVTKSTVERFAENARAKLNSPTMPGCVGIALRTRLIS